MQITLKLFATLGDYLPKGSRNNQVALEIDPRETVQQVARLTHLVLINGVFVPPAERASRRLSPGDQLAVWPPIAGG